MMDSNKERILIATIKLFNEKGLKFTMDDIAAELKISKKTIYQIFKDKESMYLHMVDYCFDAIKESEKVIIDSVELSTTDKICRILGVLPEGYRNVDFRKLYVLKEQYPDIYMKVEQRLETGWKPTIQLIEQGIREGVIRPVNICVFKTMFEATIEQFFRRDVLIVNDIEYEQALNEVVSILVDGIKVK